MKITNYSNFGWFSFINSNYFFCWVIRIKIAVVTINNFERVINNKTDSEELNSYLEGFRLIYNQIKDILIANDVKEIDAIGKEFDPMFHQSISVRKDETKESGVVLEVYQKGYTYKDKVLRPAMVIINE